MDPSQSMTPGQTMSAPFDLDDTVILNIGGTHFEVMKATLQRFPESKLGNLEHLTHHYREDKKEYYFDRSPFLFDVILNFYRFGQLHIPYNLCSETVQKELSYWEISDKLMEDCCWVPYNSQMMKNSSLNKFKKYVVVGGSRLDLTKKGKCHSCWWYKVQPKMWAFLDDHNSSRAAKAFALVSVMLVLLTTFTFVAETLPEFRHNMTEEQVAEMNSQPSSQVSTLDEMSTVTSSGSGNRKTKRSAELQKVVEGFLPEIDNVSISLIVAKLETMYSDDCPKQNRSKSMRDVVSDDPQVTEKPVVDHLYAAQDLSILSAPHPAFEIIDMIAYAFFTIELLLRIIFSPNKCEFFKNALNIIDILALLPYYVELIVHTLYMQERYQESFLDALYVLRIVRIFRIFRMVRHYRGLKVLAYTLKASAREIMLMVIFLSLGMLIFSSLIYYTKCPEDSFTSIPHAFWWAVVTMTTVGYGDMVPKSGTGYLIGSFCALSGVLVISFTVPVIVNNFMLFYQHVEYNRRKSDVEDAKVQWRRNCRESLRYRTQNGHGRLSVPTIHIESATPKCTESKQHPKENSFPILQRPKTSVKKDDLGNSISVTSI